MPRLADITRADLLESRANDFVKWLSCLSTTKNPDSASELYLRRFPTSLGSVAVRKSLETLELKEAVPPGTTTGVGWGAPLIGVRQLLDGFAALARSKTLLGRLPGVRRVPFLTKIPVETQGGNYAWVGENSVKSMAKMAFSDGTTLAMLKAQGTIPLSAEFVRLTQPGTDVALRDELLAGLVEFQDASFLDPTSAAVPGERPASITSGLAPVAGTGNLAADVDALLDSFFTARPGASDSVALIANASNGGKIRRMNGGGGVGHPVVVTGAAGPHVIVVDGNGLYYADDVTIDLSRESTVQMDTAPDNPATAATTLVSLWQINAVAYKVERFANWFAVPTSVAYLAGA